MQAPSLSPVARRPAIAAVAAMLGALMLTGALALTGVLGLGPAPVSAQTPGSGPQAPAGLMIRAEDALQSVRSDMMLGAVLPEMRQQAQALAVDLGELVRLRREIADEREKLARDLRALGEERIRLTLFVEERQRRQGDAEKELADQRRRAAELARQAENLHQIIVKLE